MNNLPNTAHEIYEFLSRSGFENPSLETRLLLCEILDTPIANIEVDRKKSFSLAQQQRLKDYWPRVEKGMPVQYQIGYTFVQGMKIHISLDTLCPGPEIEILIESAVRAVDALRPKIVLDMCTGSGVIASLLARRYPDTVVYGTDISHAALATAELNRATYELKNLRLVQGDLFEAVNDKGLHGRVGLVVCNPPYCRTHDIATLPVQVRDYAPHIAIDGGETGLEFHKRIVDGSTNFLIKGGYLVLEIEVGQLGSVSQLLGNQYKLVKIQRNHLGDPRVVVAQFKG